MCVCVRETDRQTDRDRQIDTERERDRVTVLTAKCISVDD